MSALKDVVAVVSDAARVWDDVIRLRVQRDAKSLRRRATGFVAEVLAMIAVLVLAGAGVTMILTGCQSLLVAAIGPAAGTLLLGLIVTLVALALALSIGIYLHRG